MASKLAFGFVWATSLFRGTEPCHSLCEIVDRSIPNRTTFPDNPRYNTAQSSYYSGQESELKPQCIFTPTHASEVSRFVKLVTSVSSDTPTLFAIRGGGHAVFSGAANVHHGITIDLRGLNSLSLSEDRKLATIGAGAIWSEVYPQLVPYNVTVMGGRVAGVGAGGFLTGGEYQTLFSLTTATCFLGQKADDLIQGASLTCREDTAGHATMWWGMRLCLPMAI
jgi:FAD/FMN-containing dehydrogenase